MVNKDAKGRLENVEWYALSSLPLDDPTIESSHPTNTWSLSDNKKESEEKWMRKPAGSPVAYVDARANIPLASRIVLVIFHSMMHSF